MFEYNITQENNENIVQAIPITEGMTIYMPNAQSFFEVEEKLNEGRFEIITNIDNYSVYIVSTPYEYKETIYRIK